MFSSGQEGVRQKGTLLNKVYLSIRFAFLYFVNFIRNLSFCLKKSYSAHGFSGKSSHGLTLRKRTMGCGRGGLSIRFWSRHA
jgi:hypothetical protein